MPAADAGFLRGFKQGHGGTGEDDAALLIEIDLVLDPCAPFADELRFVEKDVLGPFGARFALAPGVDHGLDAGQFQDRVIEGGVEDVGAGNAPAEEIGDGLHQKGGFADLSRSG